MRLLKTIVVLVFLYTAFTHAQKKEPKFEVLSDTMVKAIYYHNNGEISQIGCFKNGKLQGEWIMFNENGKKIAIGEYKEGKRIGEWFYWKPNGEALREVTYFNGKLVNVIEWTNSRALF